jgi:hypothetical protein
MEDLKTRVAQHLAKGAWDTCPTCGGEKAQIDPRLSVVPFESGPSIPCAVVTCRDCGHLRLFSASVLGLPKP